jgi:hypothetical protein
VADPVGPLVHLQAFVSGPAGVAGHRDMRPPSSLRAIRGDAGGFLVAGTVVDVDALVVAPELFGFLGGDRGGDRRELVLAQTSISTRQPATASAATQSGRRRSARADAIIAGTLATRSQAHVDNRQIGCTP